jgi:hypothetical protein
MKKTTRELLIVLGLLGVLLTLLLPRLLPPSGRGPSRQVVASAPQVVVQPPPPIPTVVRPSYTAEAAARRDPMVSLLPDQTQASEAVAEGRTPPARALRAGGSDGAPTPATVGGALSVEGMVWGAARTQALINGTLYEVGDVVEGARILSIERAGVTVEVDGIRHVVGQGQRGYPQPQGR